MNMRVRLLAVACVAIGTTGVAVVAADWTEPRVASGKAVSAAAAGARSKQTSTTPPARRPNVRYDDAPGEPVDHGIEWNQMSSQQRANEARIEFRRSLQLAQDGRARTELERAAAMLSVLRAELCMTDSGRQEFEQLEAEYDAVELELDHPT